jgi:hypothetical protein
MECLDEKGEPCTNRFKGKISSSHKGFSAATPCLCEKARAAAKRISSNHRTPHAHRLEQDPVDSSSDANTKGVHFDMSSRESGTNPRS